MATEADIGEVILLKEKFLTPGELYQPPQTVDYLVKSGNMEVATNVEVEIVNSSFEDNAGLIAGESFSESPLIAKLPHKKTNTKQETCQGKEILYQGEQTMPEEMQIKEERSFKATEVKDTKEPQVVDEICHQTSENTGSLKVETIEQPCLEVCEEEILKEEILIDQVESDNQASVEENQMNIEKETITPQEDEGFTPQEDEGRKEDNDVELKASNGAAMLEASKVLNEYLSVLTAVHNSDTDTETATQASLKNEHADSPGHAETVAIEEINTERISEDKLDSPSVTLETDRSSMQEETSNVASTEESQDATNLNDNTNDATSSVDQTHGETTSDTQTKESSLEAVEKMEISKMISETSQEDYVKGSPRTMLEALVIKPEADSCGDEIVMDEAITEINLDSLVKHENGGEKNIHEEMTMLDASALENRDDDMDAAVAGEENISKAVSAMQNNQDESGKEKNLSSMELNQKIETAETEFHNKNSSESHSVGQENLLVESKELGRDSNLEPQGQLHEASGDRHDENKNENDLEACESTENTANRVVTTEQNSETSESEIEKLEKVGELGSQYQSEIRDGEMSIKEVKHEEKEACETEKHKSEITDDVIAKWHTGESGSTTNSMDFLHVTMEQNFQAGSLHEEEETALKDDDGDEKTSATNDEVRDIEKVLDEEIMLANAANLSSEVIKEETVDGYLQIDKEIGVSKGKDIEHQIIKGASTACLPLKAVETPVKNFKGDENNFDNTNSREILLESETAETVGSIGNEAKQSNEEIPDSILQSSSVQEQGILHSENLITSEDSLAKEISMTNDKENHTNQPEAETGEHKEILKGVEYLEQIMQRNEDKENNEQILNVTSPETETTLSQSNANIVEERVDLAQDDESEADKTKEENITNGSYIGRSLQEAVDEDLVIFQKNESYIGQSNTESLKSRELDEKIEIAEGETPVKKINELNATHLLEKEPGESTNFETQEQVHEENGEDEEKNDETESQACKGTENTNPQSLSVKEAENTKASEEETEKSEKVHASESKEEVENKDVQMSIEDNIRNKEKFCEEDIEKLETSDNAENFHFEEVLNHEKIEQNVEAEEISTILEGEENSRQTISVIDKEITAADEITDDENIKENVTRLSSEVTNKETAESSQHAEKEGDTTAAENTEGKIILQKSIVEEPIKNLQSYGNNSDKLSSRQNFEESETAETVDSIADEAKQIDTNPNSTPQSSLVTGQESSQSENQTRCDGSPAEEIVIDGSSITEAKGKENYELSECGEQSKELLKGEEDAEQTPSKDDTEQPLHVISLDTRAEALSQIDKITVKETAESPHENEERDAGTEKEVGVNESNSKCLQLESVAQNSAKDFENDKRIEKSNTEILEESEVVERGQNIIHEANQSDETPNETIPLSLAKEEESLLFEDKGIPEETSLVEKKEEGSSIMLLEEDNKEIDKQTSEPTLEINQNEESLNSSLQTSVETETEQTLQEEPQEKGEQPLENMEETVAGPQDDEGDAETAKQEDGVSKRNTTRLPLEHVALDLVKNLKNHSDAAEKSYTEILEQPEVVESIENITHEIDQNDSPDTTTPAALAEDSESLQYEVKNIAVEASAEEKKEEACSVKTGEDNNGSIPGIEENNIEGDQDTSKTDDYSVDDKIQNEESLNSSTQASEMREEVTLGSDNLTPAEAFTRKDEDGENYTAQIEVGEHNKEDAEEILQKAAQDPINNFKNVGDGAETSNKEILEQTKAEQSVESITDETNQNDSPSETNPAAPAEDVESLQFEDKEVAIEVSTEEKKEEPSSSKTSEDSNDDIIMLEENNKEGDQETSKTGGYSALEMMQNEESLSSPIQASLVREVETVGSDNLTSVETSIKKDEDKESYTGLIDVGHNEELVEKENEEQILQKDEPRESTEEPLNVIYTETEAETLGEFKETVDTTEDNEKRDTGREKDVMEESNIRSLPLESVAQTPAQNFENDDAMEKTGEEFQENTQNTDIPEEEEVVVDDHDTKEHIIDECDTNSISKEPVNQGTTKEMQNDEDNDKISNKEILEETLKGEIGESIALETNQNYETTNTTAPTASVKEGGSLQDERENVNLEEPSLEAKEDEGYLANASQVIGCHAELSEASMQSEAERSHGEENMEPKLQNEPEEFVDLLSNVITQVSDIAILDKNFDDTSIAEDIRTVQNNEKTEEEETKGNEDSDGSKLNDVTASEDIKVTAKTYYSNEADLETTKAHVSDYSEKNGEHISKNNEKEINEDNITKFQGDNTACMNEDTEKHIIMEEQLSRDISPQLDGEETNLTQENKEEIAQTEMHEEFELPRTAEDTAQHVPEEIDIEKDQCTESATVIADDLALIVPKTEMHEIIQTAVKNSNTGEQIMQEGREVQDILEVPLRGINAESLPEKDKDDENDNVKSKQEIEGIQSQLKEESAAVCYKLEKSENLKDKQGSDIDLYHVKASEEGIVPKESTELDAISLESTSKVETLGKEEPFMSCVIKERSIEEVEQEDRKQLECSGPHNQEDGLERVEKTGTLLDCTSINAPQDEAPNLVENKDREIQTEADRAEDLKFEIQDKALNEDSSNHNETAAFATLSEKMPDHNLKEGSLLPSNDSDLMNVEESKPMDDNSAKYPTIHEKLENEHMSQVTELAENINKIKTAEEIPELAIMGIEKVRASEEEESYNSRDLNQDLVLHNEQYQVDQQEMCKSETDDEASDVGDDALKCTESTNADKEEDILDKGRFNNKSEASLKENEAAEKATDEHVAENINQVVVTTETESYGVPAEENLESADPSMKLEHVSETLPSNQSSETIPKSSPNKLEENCISESVEQRSKGSPESWQEMEVKTELDLEDKNQINETIDVEDIKAAIFTEEVCKEVEKAEGDETVDHFNMDGDGIKELQSAPIGGEIIHEVKESSFVSPECLKVTDSNQPTETGSLEVREAQNLEKEASVTKENEETKEDDEDYQRNIGLLYAVPSKETQEVIKKQIIDNPDSSSDKIKAASTLEVKAEPGLEEVQIDEKPVLVSNIPSDASSPHTAEIDAGQQDSMVFEGNSSNLQSQLPTDDQETVALENIPSENAAVDDIEESKETSDVYETKNHDARELHTGEVREEIKGAAETAHNPQAAEKHTEKVGMTKEKPPTNSSALNTVEDRSLQMEVPDISQLNLQVKKGSPDSLTEEHKEKGGTLCDSKEESKAASGMASQSKCHSLEATEINEVADDQTLHSKKSDEQYQTEPCVLLSNEMEFGCSTQIQKLEDAMKGEELLGGELRKSEEGCLQKEESSELQVSEPELEAKKDAEESSNESQMEVNVTSIEIDKKKEASESKLDSNSEGNEAAKEEVVEEITPVQSIYTDKSHEENSMPSNPLLSKEQEGEASTITASIEEKRKEMQSLGYKPDAIQDACLQKEEPVELKVLSSEDKPHKDGQENLKETHEKADEAINGVKEENEEVSKSVFKSSSQDNTAVSEDKITSNQPQPTEKPKEENQKSVAGLLFENQEHKISTIPESIEGKITREEEPENAPKTIEEPPLQKEEPWEFKPSGLELQIGDDIQNESQKNVRDGEEGTAEQSHEIEKINAEKTNSVALENQREKTTDATEVMHTEVTNEKIMEENSYAKSNHAITHGEDATKEGHQEHEQTIEEAPGVQIYEKTIQNEVELSVKKASESTKKDQISAEKEPETVEKEVVEVHQQEPNIEKEKSDEEGGEEKKNSESGSDGPVMVESSRDIELKIAEKKSHNILAGVGSKVKHSIIKVKKAITSGKSSSHTKQHQNHGCFAP